MSLLMSQGHLEQLEMIQGAPSLQEVLSAPTPARIERARVITEIVSSQAEWERDQQQAVESRQGIDQELQDLRQLMQDSQRQYQARRRELEQEREQAHARDSERGHQVAVDSIRTELAPLAEHLRLSSAVPEDQSG
jgi:F0F1-type ATP synthase membrane subunit b/b'